MCGETRRDDVRRSRRDRKRGRVSLNEQGVLHAGAREDAQTRLEHLARRVDPDRGSEARRDAAERVTDAGADVDDALAAVVGRQRDDAVEILSAGVVRTLDVPGRCAAELLLDRLDAAHFVTSTLANSTVFSR